MGSGLREKIRNNKRSLAWAIGLHALLVFLLVFTIQYGGIVPTGGAPADIVEAVVVQPEGAGQPMPQQPDVPPPD
ncbi:MAG: hypothetical protein L0H19_06480, partial [Salinisphaera sp.]|nr:hypothetical protein [Salinisphaera sp.]